MTTSKTNEWEKEFHNLFYANVHMAQEPERDRVAGEKIKDFIRSLITKTNLPTKENK